MTIKFKRISHDRLAKMIEVIESKPDLFDDGEMDFIEQMRHKINFTHTLPPRQCYPLLDLYNKARGLPFYEH